MIKIFSQNFHRQIVIAKAASSTSFREKLAYKSNIGAEMLTYGLFIFIFSRIWANVYSGQAQIAGYSVKSTIWYFIIAEIVTFCFGSFFSELSREMKSGQIAYMISRPYDFVNYQFAEKFGGLLYKLIVIAIQAAIMGFILTGSFPEPQETLFSNSSLFFVVLTKVIHFLYIAISVLLGGMIQFFLYAALAFTAFWFEENAAFYWIFNKLTLIIGTFIPIEFLPDNILKIVRWTVFPYIAYAPARITVMWDFSNSSKLILYQLIWLSISILIARFVFNCGSKKISINGG